MSHSFASRATCRRVVQAAVASLLVAGAAGAAKAATVTVQVNDAAGLPIADAVIYADPTGGQTMPKVTRSASIEQKARQFQPIVTVVQVGTEVAFPNNDTVRHHVYSFSKPKVFELKLYTGIPGSPVLFDKTGTVVVGCNIHDQMLAYIQVVDTPYFARTNAAGQARIEDVVPGKYSLKYWYYKTPAPTQIRELPLVVTAADTTATFKVPARPAGAE